MITKFKTIRNLAVFQDFDWDKHLRDKGNNIAEFNTINILYGRNYSGKTSLSRILRALETSVISDKYENPNFEVMFDDNTKITQLNLSSHTHVIRVFNEDFVKENLRFIVDPDKSIAPFAILGGNVELEGKIEKLETELGKVEEGKESGFYLELKNAKLAADKASQAYQLEEDELNRRLRDKATGNPEGIKYQSERFGDINYNINKLLDDIKLVLDVSFNPLTNDEVAQKSTLIREQRKDEVTAISKPNIDYISLYSEAKELVTKSVSSSDKIEQLLKDATISRWVQEGRKIHKDKPEICSFCGNQISVERWRQLESHFDEETDKLEKSIDRLIEQVDDKLNNIDSVLSFENGWFYSKFHPELELLKLERQKYIEATKSQLSSIRMYLVERKNDILNPKKYFDFTDYSTELETCWERFENLRMQSNHYNKLLGDEQTKAKKMLRLREVHDFLKIIDYKTLELKIEKLKITADGEEKKKRSIEEKIIEHQKLIKFLVNQLRDERKGAQKVNEYLNNYFGHDSLSLEAMGEGDQKLRFEVFRNGKKAFHLSEGECSLIAFSYFLAKLEDTETKGYKPIIWIDDPISSLDANHIFFVYSLINAQIISQDAYKQIFISTHNLDFLKYLKRLPGASNKKTSGYFLILREGDRSKIQIMPDYLKEYVTEFHFLFHQIYKCSTAEADDVSQHTLFYNFGNNTRKFLEMFLYYRYPDAKRDTERLKRFFGDDTQASVLIERINNEFSHLEGLFERSMAPLDIPEMKKMAIFILDKIKNNDSEQYSALLSSIGVDNDIELD